jgi:hypothetical protein
MFHKNILGSSFAQAAGGFDHPFENYERNYLN